MMAGAFSRLGYAGMTWLFVALAAASLFFADLRITTLDPWTDLMRMLGGLAQPDLTALRLRSVVYTVAFAVLGVALGAAAGLLLMLAFARSRAVRIVCAGLRSVHELFWALLLMQVTGLSAATGILAIALPYAGIFAKVFAELIEEADLAAVAVLPPRTGTVSAFAYARLPELAKAFGDYTLYRLECGLRSTLVLGFIGLPTMGFYLESAFRQGRYAEAGAFLLLFYLLIGTRRLWARVTTAPFLLLASVLVLPATVGSGSIGANLSRLLTHDLVPAPLRGRDLLTAPPWLHLIDWLRPIMLNEIVPGVWHTLVLAQVALVVTALAALLAFPLATQHFAGRGGQPLGRVLLVIVRSTPEYMAAYVLLQVLGPSMLPAIVALAAHNAGIVAYLMARHADALPYRQDAPSGLDLYAYETVPRLYGQFLAYLLYRWEIIMRESAILGMLGVTTLGFYVDAAIAELRLDAALVLILSGSLLTIAVDASSRSLRRSLRIENGPARRTRQHSAAANATPGIGASLREDRTCAPIPSPTRSPI